MHIRTVSITVAAPSEPVFNFLANIENLPDWATGFCERLELRQGTWWAYTARGEMLVEAEAHAATGIIDLRIGPAPDRLELLPVRVLPLGARRSLVSLTCIQAEGMSDELFEHHYRSLLVELQGLARRFGGGEIHPPVGAPRFMELGAN